MNIWKLVAGVALLFILGVLIGSLGTRFYFKHHYPPPPADPKAKAAFIMNKLSKELDLTQDQKIRIEGIVEKMEARLHEHFLQVQPEAKKIIDDGFSQIKNKLNEDQKTKLDVLKERFERRRPGRRGPR